MNVNDKHRHRRPIPGAFAVVEECERCGRRVPYGTLDNDLLCSDCARLMEPRLSNDVWERLNARWRVEARLGVYEPPDYSGPARDLPEVPCDVCGRPVRSVAALCPPCREVSEDEDRRFAAVPDWGLPGVGLEGD